LYNVEAFGTPGRNTGGKDSDQEKDRDQNPMKSSICPDGIHSDLVERYTMTQQPKEVAACAFSKDITE
jgi:hypothetical protein